MKNLKFLYVVMALAIMVAMIPAAAASAAPNKAAVACDQTYTATAGDWLSKLADKFLGNVNAYWAIMWATDSNNAADPTKFKTKLVNADQLEVGDVLCIPSKADADAFLKDFDPNTATGLAKLFPAGAKGQLIVGSWWTNGGEFAGLNQMFQMYKTQNPDVEIINAAIAGGAGTNFKGQLLSQLLGGVAPDVFQLHAGKEVETYNPGTLVVPIDDVYTKDGYEKLFPPDLVSLLKYKDHFWGVPVNIHRADVLWYNKSLLTKAGITAPPTNWDEFFAAADKLKAAGIAPVALGGHDGFELQHTLETILISELGADGWKGLWNGKTSWTDPKVTTALDVFKKYISYANADHDALSWAAATQLLIDGKAAFNIMGDWANGNFVAANFTDYGWAPVPGTKGIFDALSDSFALPAKAPDKDNAALWLDLVGSKAAQEAFNKAKGSICARTDCDYSSFNAYLQSSAADWKTDAIVPSVVHGAAAGPNYLKAYNDAVSLFATNGDAAAFQSALATAQTTGANE